MSFCKDVEATLINATTFSRMSVTRKQLIAILGDSRIKNI